MVIFDLAILPPIWFVIYLSAKNSRPGRGLKVSLWWSFYISVPLFIYDLIYCGVYLGYGMGFLVLVIPIDARFLDASQKGASDSGDLVAVDFGPGQRHTH